MMLTYTYNFGNDFQERPVFEFLARGGIDGVVCMDLDSDGRCGPAEPPVPSVLVRMSNGQMTRKDALGRYAFEALPPGYYSVEVDERALRELGRLTTSSVSSFELPAAGKQQAVFGVTQTCRIAGSVVDDLDMDGERSPADVLVPGARVTATRGDLVVSGHASNMGSFRIDVPECGAWRVELDPGSLPAPTVVTAGQFEVQADPSQIPTVTLMVASLRTLQGTVFVDENGNGLRESNEPTLSGVKVQWRRGASTTGASGTFLFRRLPAGRIELSVDPATLPAGHAAAEPVVVELGREPVMKDGILVPVKRVP